MSQKINVDIITEYKGRQNLKNAEKDMGVLGETAKKLAKTFAATFAAEKILAFGKASVEAFAADEKSAKILGNTLNNLGLAFTDIPVEKFITNLSELNGIAKTDLRNSFSTLVRSTGDATKAQDLLSLGLDISSGTGKDLASVTKALAKAYGGSYTALSKLGAGLTKAEIATGNFAAIQAHLAQVFKGDAAIAAESFSGKIARLKTSFEEFKITIGAGLVDAFTSLSKGGDLTAFQETMHSVAMDVADMVRGIGIFGGDIASIVSKVNSISGGLIGKILGFSIKNSIVGALVGVGSNARAKAAAAASTGSTVGEYQNNVANAARTAKANAAVLTSQKAITDQKKKQLDLDRATLSLKLAGNTTDMQNIEIQAALQRGQNAEVTNVLLLQRAILSGNADQANVLAQQVLKANGLVMDVNGNISSLAGAKDPFKDWPPATSAALAQVKAIQDAIASIQDKKVTITVTTVTVPGGGGGSTANGVAGTTKLASGAIAGLVDDQGFTYMQPAAGAPQIDPSKFGSGIVSYDQANFSKGASAYYDKLAGVNSATTGTQPIAVTVNLNGQVVGNAITNAQVDQSASGIPSSFQRSGFGSYALQW
jgi:hypothetical protein